MDQPALRIWMAALYLMISSVSAPFLNVSFFSLAADLVPMDIRGRYFAVRTRVATVFSVAGGILTAWVLDTFTGFNGYALVFALATVTGVMDIVCFFAVEFPAMAARERTETFGKMLSGVLRNRKYMKFTLFMALWYFAVCLSGPFYMVHLRTGVQFSNTLITLLMQILPNICSILIITRWGQGLDMYGNRTIMRITGCFLWVSSFFWIFTGHGSVTASIVLVAIVGLMQGFVYPGFDIGINNMMMGQAPQMNRSMYIAVYLTVTSILGIGAANAAGGWLLDNVFARLEPFQFSVFGVVMTRYNWLFALTALLRCGMFFVAFPRLLPGDGDTPVREVLARVLKRLAH